VSEYIFTVYLKHSSATVKKKCCKLGNEKPDSVPRARGTPRPKMGKPTVLLTAAKVTQERADYSTNKQASNCEGVQTHQYISVIISHQKGSWQLLANTHHCTAAIPFMQLCTNMTSRVWQSAAWPSNKPIRGGPMHGFCRYWKLSSYKIKSPTLNF